MGRYQLQVGAHHFSCRCELTGEVFCSWSSILSFHYKGKQHNMQEFTFLSFRSQQFLFTQYHMCIYIYKYMRLEARFGIGMYPLFQWFFSLGKRNDNFFWLCPRKHQMIGNTIKWLVLFNSWFLQVVGPVWRSWMEWNGAPTNACVLLRLLMEEIRLTSWGW